MAMTRRHVLRLVGGGAILAAAGAAGGFAATRTPTRALVPWTAAGGYADARLNALSYAILAPNPHNLQPWMIELLGDDGVRILRDPERALPHTDPFDRQITIGFGCFLEQMRIAASQTGHEIDVTLFPDGAVAELRFREGGAPDGLAAAILERRSCKEPFEARGVEAGKARELEAFADIYTDAEPVAQMREITWEAFRIEAETPRTYKESVDVMRFGKAEIEASPDGIDLGGPFLESLMVAGLLTRESQLDPESASVRQVIKSYREMLNATPAYAVIVTEGNTRADQIEAGRRWLRLNLKTTEMGLGLHPVSQCLQEYPEMSGQFERIHTLLAKPGQTVQMLGRLGYGPMTARTPRWPLEAKRMDV